MTKTHAAALSKLDEINANRQNSDVHSVWTEMEQGDDNSILSMSICGCEFFVTKVCFTISFSFLHYTNIYFTSKITLELRRKIDTLSSQEVLILHSKFREFKNNCKSILFYQERIPKTAVSVVSLLPDLLAKDLDYFSLKSQ